MNTMGVLYILAIIFLFVLAVLWFILPFALFGIKPLLREILAELRAQRTSRPSSTQPSQPVLQHEPDRARYDPSSHLALASELSWTAICAVAIVLGLLVWGVR